MMNFFLQSHRTALAALALGAAIWASTTVDSMAQGKPRQNASANDQRAMNDLCTAVQNNPQRAPQLARRATQAHPEQASEILRTAFRCVGVNDQNCDLLGRILRAITSVVPDQASALYDLAVQLAPNCASVFPPPRGGGGGEPGAASLGNQNVPPGTIAGGGGQGNVVAICHNNMTIFVSPQGAEAHLRNHPGDRLGPCVVTGVTNR